MQNRVTRPQDTNVFEERNAVIAAARLGAPVYGRCLKTGGAQAIYELSCPSAGIRVNLWRHACREVVLDLRHAGIWVRRVGSTNVFLPKDIK